MARFQDKIINFWVKNEKCTGSGSNISQKHDHLTQPKRN